MPSRNQRLKIGGRSWTIVSLLAAGLLTYLLATLQAGPGSRTAGVSTRLWVYCAAGVKPPVSAAIAAYENEPGGMPVDIQFGGSGTLLNNLRVARKGDLYVAADESYIELARQYGVVREALPVARLTPVIAVARGNPRQIRTTGDLLRPDVRVGLANPDAASIGRLSKQLLEAAGVWNKLQARLLVLKPTVSDVANDVLLGALDAAIIWDAVARQHADTLEMVEVPAWQAAAQHVTIGVLDWAKDPTAALRFARYLQAPAKGQAHFRQMGYQTVDGDAWEPVPELTVYSGGVNRVAIEKTLREFEAREGVRLNTVYNGCGILVGQILGGAKPDAYFACDTSFVTPVQDLFEPPVTISETDVVIAVQRDNPQAIKTVQDLATPDLRVGVANPQQSALGMRTQRLLESVPYDSTNLYDAVQPQVVVQTPTADLLVNQLRSQALDAAIVYGANVSQVLDQLHIIPIDVGKSVATQPLVLSKSSAHPYLVRRLRQALTTPDSRRRFEQAGFRWKSGTPES